MFNRWPPVGQRGAVVVSAVAVSAVAVSAVTVSAVAVSAVALTACVGPSGNLGEPVAPGAIGLTLETRTIRHCAQVRFNDAVAGEVDGELASEDGIICDPAQNLALVVPTAVGARYGLAAPMDLGLTLGQSASGVNTRVRLLGEERQLSGVWTLDARKGYRAFELFDVHSRLLLFAPLGPVRLLVGAGASYGKMEHWATRAQARSETEGQRAGSIAREELHADGVLGFGPKNSLLYVFVAPYWVVRHGPIESISASNVLTFELEHAVVIGVAMTLPVWPKSPREALTEH